MTVTLPEASFTWESSHGPAVRGDADPAQLLALALAYHGAQYGLSATAEAASRDLFLRLRPINDADMAEWMSAWNVLLAAQQRQQHALTESYIRTTLRLYGMELDRLISLNEQSLADLEKMARSSAWSVAKPALRRDIADAAARLGGRGVARLDDHLLADRALNLASPVIKVRVETAAGATLSEALDLVVPEVEAMTFNANRAAERIAMGGINWPSFKNGNAMLYRRVITPGACGWCAIVATRLYGAASGRRSAIWHRGCRCTWQLVSEADATSYAKTLRGSEGDYFAAARAAGLWRGDAPASTADFITEVRAVKTDQNGSTA